MPVLDDLQHERFARLLARNKDLSQEDAYEMAGFNRHAGNASRLRNSEKVKARIKEIVEESYKAANLDEIWVKAKLMYVVENHIDENPAAAVRSLELIGKTEGLEMFVDRSKRQEIPQTWQDIVALAEKLPAEEKKKLMGLVNPDEPEPEPLKVVNIKGKVG